jgi:hypothetical protein
MESDQAAWLLQLGEILLQIALEAEGQDPARKDT